MAQNLSVLLLSRSGTRLNTLEDVLQEHDGVATLRKLISVEDKSPLSDLSGQPDLIVLDLGDDWQTELYTVSEDMSLGQKLPIIVLSQSDDAGMMRKAMQAGARDYFSSPIAEEELVASIRQIGRETQLHRRKSSGKITAVINGKGGSGATVVASNLSRIARGNIKKNPSSVVIVDFDLQFGNLPVYFDLESNDNLMQALIGANDLDAVALDGLVQLHDSGVKVLASKPEQIRSAAEINAGSVQSLLSMLSRNHDHVIVDLPRVLDPYVIAALELSDTVLVTTRQSVPHVRDTRYLLSLLRDVGVSTNSIRMVVNKYNKKNEIKLADMRNVFQGLEFFLLPEDPRKVAYSVNNGVPVTIRWPKAPFSKAIEQLSNSIWPVIDANSRK